ncbi:MAG TPA: helix-turn-helix transcriptional regulator [Terriglobales bacterium]|nr:helix-turn-helix transcriptional regulator [Terriglobales bacterium]
MLASKPHPEAGQQLKAARLRTHLSTRDVERLSREIAAEVNNQDCCISHAWITHVENGEFRPGIYKLYTLARIYKLKPDEVLSFFGLSLHDVERGYMSLNLPRTHLVGPVHEQPGQTVVAPLALRSTFRLEQTNLISRMFDKWGEIPVGLLQQVDLRNSVLGYIGLEDRTMYPWIRPGSLVQIDSRQKAIKAGGWRHESERPIYFVELREKSVCSWCDLEGNRLFLIPSSLSGQQVRSVRYPIDAEVVGRITAIIMRMTESQGG